MMACRIYCVCKNTDTSQLLYKFSTFVTMYSILFLKSSNGDGVLDFKFKKTMAMSVEHHQ